MPGSLPGKPLADGSPGPSLYCAVIIKQVDEKTRAKTSVNDLLRDSHAVLRHSACTGSDTLPVGDTG